MEKMTDEELVNISFDINKIACTCPTIQDGLRLLTCALAGFIKFQGETDIERKVMFGACVAELREYERLMISKNK